MWDDHEPHRYFKEGKEVDNHYYDNYYEEATPTNKYYEEAPQTNHCYEEAQSITHYYEATHTNHYYEDAHPIIIIMR